MISCKLFLRGFYWLNIFCSPVHLWMILLMNGCDRCGHSFAYKVSFSLCFALVPQIISLLLLIFAAKIWDFFITKNNFYSINITLKGTIFGALLSAFIITIVGNIYLDNLFAFKHGNYGLVFMPFFLLIFYYKICHLIGNATSTPKYLI